MELKKAMMASFSDYYKIDQDDGDHRLESDNNMIVNLEDDNEEEEDDDEEEEEEEEGGPLPGFRFHPTDEELVSFYLKRKVNNNINQKNKKKKKKRPPLSIEIIKEVDIYKHDPWDLAKASNTLGDKEWYFYCKRGRKYRNSIRPNRVTGSGFWKATGIDRPIYSDEIDVDVDGSSAGRHQLYSCIGLKKSLVYYRGTAGKGTKTDWMMHEFRLPSIVEVHLQSAAPNNNNHHHHLHLQNAEEAEIWTLCRIFKRNRKYTPDWRDQVSTTKRSSSNSVVNSSEAMQMMMTTKTTTTTSGRANNSNKACSAESSNNSRECYISFQSTVDLPTNQLQHQQYDHHHHHHQQQQQQHSKQYYNNKETFITDRNNHVAHNSISSTNTTTNSIGQYYWTSPVPPTMMASSVVVPPDHNHNSYNSTTSNMIKRSSSQAENEYHHHHNHNHPHHHHVDQQNNKMFLDRAADFDGDWDDLSSVVEFATRTTTPSLL